MNFVSGFYDVESKGKRYQKANTEYNSKTSKKSPYCCLLRLNTIAVTMRIHKHGQNHQFILIKRHSELLHDYHFNQYDVEVLISIGGIGVQITSFPIL